MKCFSLVMILLGLTVSFFTIKLKAQTWFVGCDTVPSKFRIDGSFAQIGIGTFAVNTKSNLPPESAFILSTPNKTLWQINFDLQAIFKDKIGFETGFDFPNGNMNETKIRKEFQNYFPNYKINIADFNAITGENPFSGGYDFRIFKVGVIGFIPYKRLFILPYADFLYNIESDYPALKVQFTDLLNNNSFTREYKFYNTNCVGFKCGASLRCYFQNDNKKIKRPRLYMQIRTEFVYLQPKGYGYYLDTSSNNNQSKSNSNNFSQNVYAFVIGITLGGLDLHW